MWQHFVEGIRQRLRLRFPEKISAHHPVISARPYRVLLFTPGKIRASVHYIEADPQREGLASQRWPFVSAYDNRPFHKRAGKG